MTKPLMELAGYKALITGASRGIGYAIALELGRNGAEVYGTATQEKGLEQIAKMLKDENIQGKPFLLNVTDSDSVTQLFSQLEKEGLAPDILVNNAAITRDGLLIKLSAEDWNDVIQTNLSSVYQISKFCIRGMMKKRWGRIINIASISGLMGNAGQCNYAAAKAGIIGFSKSLAREVAVRNITVNCIAPGFIDTDMTQALPEKLRADLCQQIPVKRFGKPEEIARFITVLASDAGGYITGETINISGGLYMS